jgi:hypothetical protein
VGVRVIARVECRSEAAAEQLPIAVWLAEERIPVAEILADSVEGAVEAGRPAQHRVKVRLADGQVFELLRELPLGDWAVYREQFTA